MRSRVTARPAALGVVATGTLALAAAFLPVAHAAPVAGATTQVRVTPAVSTTNTMDVTFSAVSVDKGAATFPVGTTNTVAVPYTYTLTARGVDPSHAGFSTALDLYRGAVTGPANQLSGGNASCERVSAASGAVTETCSGHVDIHPHELHTADAGATWKGVAYAYDAASTGWAQRGTWPAPRLTRYATAKAAVSAGSVAHGRTVTVSGTLVRASWDTHKYWGYAGVRVAVQFRPENGTAYTTVTTLTTDADGTVRGSVTPSASGYWRVSFAGSATTSSATATGVAVTVH